MEEVVVVVSCGIYVIGQIDVCFYDFFLGCLKLIYKIFDKLVKGIQVFVGIGEGVWYLFFDFYDIFLEVSQCNVYESLVNVDFNKIS